VKKATVIKFETSTSTSIEGVLVKNLEFTLYCYHAGNWLVFVWYQ